MLSVKRLPPRPCTAVFCGPAVTFTVVVVDRRALRLQPGRVGQAAGADDDHESRIALPLASTPMSPVELGPLIETRRFRRVPPLTVTYGLRPRRPGRVSVVALADAGAGALERDAGPETCTGRRCRWPLRRARPGSWSRGRSPWPQRSRPGCVGAVVGTRPVSVRPC